MLALQFLLRQASGVRSVLATPRDPADAQLAAQVQRFSTEDVAAFEAQVEYELGRAGSGGGATDALPPIGTAGLQASSSGRYASYEDSVESKQAGGAAASGRGGGSGRVPPLHLSRVSVSDLLHGGGSEGAPAAGGQLQLGAVSAQDRASISRLAQSMHSSGMGAVTPGDIRAALAGEGHGSLRMAREHACRPPCPVRATRPALTAHWPRRHPRCRRWRCSAAGTA